MQLRNRKTGKFVKPDAQRQTHFFSPTIVESKEKIAEEHEYAKFVNDHVSFIKKQLGEIPGDAQLSLIKDITQYFYENKKQIDEFRHNPDSLEKNLTQMIFGQLLKMPKNEYTTSFLSVLFNQLPLINSLALPALVMTLLSSIPAVAAQNGWQVHGDQPSGNGAMDLCSGILFGCVQGYLTNGSSPWTSGNPQFNRVVVQAGKSNSGVYEQLKSCMSSDHVGDIASKTLSLAKSNTTQPCFAQSSLWQGYQVTAELTSTPSDVCSTFQNQFASDSQACMSLLGQAKYTGIIIGVTIGGVALIAAIVALACWMKSRCDRQEPCYFESCSNARASISNCCSAFFGGMRRLCSSDNNETPLAKDKTLGHNTDRVSRPSV